MINGWLILNILSTEISKMKIALIIFAGSGAGGVLRYFIQKIFIDAGFIQFPAGTFVVNIAGCFLIGLFEALAAKNNIISRRMAACINNRIMRRLYYFQHVCKRKY